MIKRNLIYGLLTLFTIVLFIITKAVQLVPISVLVIYFIVLVILFTLTNLICFNRSDETKTKKRFSIINYIFVLMFFLILALPLLNINMSDVDQREKRKLAEFPKLFIDTDFNVNAGKEFESWLSDRFGFRKVLLDFNHNLNFNILKISTKENVLIGKDNWLFEGNKTNSDIDKVYNKIACYQHTDRFTPDQLEIVRKNLESRYKWLEHYGIKMYLFFPPNKSTIYGEYFPDGIVQSKKPSRMDQVISYLKEKSFIEVIDAREELMAEKKNREVYYKTDTHWNYLGAFIGYQKLMRRIAQDYPGIKIMEESDFNVRYSENGNGGNLKMMLGIESYPHQNDYHFTPKKGYSYQLLKDEGAGGVLSIIQNPDESQKLRMLMFRDSFTNYLYRFLGESFSYAEYYWVWDGHINNLFNHNMIVNKNPDIVIVEIVELFMINLLKDTPKLPTF